MKLAENLNRGHHIKTLKLLCSAAGAELTEAGKAIVFKVNNKSIKLSALDFKFLLENQFVEVKATKCKATRQGKQYLKRLMCDVDGFQAQHQELVSAEKLGHKDIRAKVNLKESPLMRLKQMRTKSGEAFLSDGEFQAGERLRKEFDLSHLSPQITMNWDRLGAGGSSSSFGSGGKIDMADSALAARQRLDKALQAVGPELSGALQDICCFLKGLEQVERERAWPQRSAKFMLKIALGILARHYGYQGYFVDQTAKMRPKLRHWGVEGYSPKGVVRR